MNRSLTLFAASLALLLAACNGAQTDEAAPPPDSSQSGAESAQPAAQEENAWAFLEFWNWFDSDQPAEPSEELSAEEAQAQAQAERASEESTQEMEFTDYFLPWKWFEDDQPASQPTDTAQVAADPGQQRQPFTYVETRQEKEFTDYLLPWKWFEDEEPVAAVPEFESFRRVEAGPTEEDNGFFLFRKAKKQQGPKPVTLDDVLSDMSPELVTRAEREEETRIRRAKVFDINTRSIWDDLNDIFFLDRPSRLSMSPTP